MQVSRSASRSEKITWSQKRNLFPNPLPLSSTDARKVTIMNICLVLPGFSANEQDWCIPAFLDFVRTLAARHDVSVVALRYPHSRAQYDVYGARVTCFDGREQRGFQAFALRAGALKWIIQAHRTRPFDVLHAFFADEAGLIAALGGKLLRVPSVVSLAGGELVGLRDIGYGGQQSLVSRRAIQVACSLASRVTVGSRMYQDLARKFVGSSQVIYAPLGVDTELFSAASHKPHLDLYLLNVASLVPVKDQMRLLNVFRRVHERVPRARLRIVGAGPLERTLREYCRDLAMEGLVEFPGSVEHHLLVDNYQDADLFILTSRHEAQGMAALEAAACGLPVIGTRVGILPEIGQVEDDDEALSDAIVRLANDPDALGMIRQKIRARVERDYSLPASLARWEGIYESLARTRGGVPSA